MKQRDKTEVQVETEELQSREMLQKQEWHLAGNVLKIQQ